MSINNSARHLEERVRSNDATVLNTREGRAEYYMYVASNYEKIGNTEEAEAYLNKAIEEATHV